MSMVVAQKFIFGDCTKGGFLNSDISIESFYSSLVLVILS